LTAEWAFVDRHCARWFQEQATQGGTMTAITIRVLAVILGVLAVGIACGGGDDGESETNASATTPQLASDLQGTYERTVTKSDIARTAGAVVKERNFEPSPPGPRRLEIDNGSFTVIDLRDNFRISQSLTASDDGNFDIGDYIRPDKGAFCGPRVPQGAVYSWTLENDLLVLKAESDSCADRDSILTGRWKRTDER
jgi:hypothetical protein